FRKTKISQLRFTHLTLCSRPAVEQNIARLEIPVDHAVLMGIIDGQADKGKQIDDVGTRPHFCCTRCASQVISQRMPINIIRYETDHRAYRAVGISGGVDKCISGYPRVGGLSGTNRLRLLAD